MQIFVSQLADKFQAKTADFNEHLNSWGKSNRIPIIMTDIAFKLGTGGDDMCFNMDREASGFTLNRYGSLDFSLP